MDNKERTKAVNTINITINNLNTWSNSNQTPTEARQKNARLMGAILKVLEANDKPMSISQLMADSALTDLNGNQHCNSLLIMMRMGGSVQRIEGKDSPVFTIAGREVTTEDEVGSEKY